MQQSLTEEIYAVLCCIEWLFVVLALHVLTVAD